MGRKDRIGGWVGKRTKSTPLHVSGPSQVKSETRTVCGQKDGLLVGLAGHNTMVKILRTVPETTLRFFSVAGRRFERLLVAQRSGSSTGRVREAPEPFTTPET